MTMKMDSDVPSATVPDLNSVDIEIDLNPAKLNIDDPIVLLRKHPTKVEKLELPSAPVFRPPDPKFSVVKDYHIQDAPDLTTEYLSADLSESTEIGTRVEYDFDEEDAVWLRLVNERRRVDGLHAVSIDDVEYLIDRLEKESFIIACRQAADSLKNAENDLLCCICNDGECQTGNAILYCKKCQISVHQGCYGVPSIPEGTWLCQRCVQTPPVTSRCCLCPSSSGAFKRTSDDRWVHVICALWVPEVSFGNAVFLEPVEDIETIPASRWTLTCSLCRKKDVGACIQCQNPLCQSAFHVTCAQKANLHMKMETVKEASPSGRGGVKKVVKCGAHGPPGPRPHASWAKSPPKFNPSLPEALIAEIAAGVIVKRKKPFVKQLVAYWILKRQERNWAPLIERLQTIPMDVVLATSGRTSACSSGIRREVDSAADSIDEYSFVDDVSECSSPTPLRRVNTNLKKEVLIPKQTNVFMDLENKEHPRLLGITNGDVAMKPHVDPKKSPMTLHEHKIVSEGLLRTAPGFEDSMKSQTNVNERSKRTIKPKKVWEPDCEKRVQRTTPKKRNSSQGLNGAGPLSTSKPAPNSQLLENVTPPAKSFLQYRNSEFAEVGSDDEASAKKPASPGILSGVESSSTSSSSSSSSSSLSSDESDADVAPESQPQRRKKVSPPRTDSRFQPLDLVWAKCRGYPWYPALVIDPAMPRNGFQQNGVPIPVPPEDVLLLKKRFPDREYLVLFFDNRRNWQWLAKDKLDPLGVNSAFDQAKLIESKKPTDRKAVKKAYERAVVHYAKVMSEKDILSGVDLDSV